MKIVNLTLLAMILAGCQYQYLGDGEFVDSGYKSAADRYKLSLGVINVCQTQQYSYTIGQLPPEDLKLNFAYCEESLDEENYKYIVDIISGAVLDLAVMSEGRKEISSYTGPIWETGINKEGVYYQKGMHPSFKSNDKCVNWVFMPDQIGYSMKASLIKVLRTHNKRELRMKIVNPIDATTKRCEANLSLIGGGWK